jgi:hypothetical protein
MLSLADLQLEVGDEDGFKKTLADAQSFCEHQLDLLYGVYAQ